jgi:hypothetical protein
MLTMPFTVAVYMVRGFLQAQQQQQQQQGAPIGAGSSSVGAGGVDEQLVGQLTGALVSVQ